MTLCYILICPSSSHDEKLKYKT